MAAKNFIILMRQNFHMRKNANPTKKRHMPVQAGIFLYTFALKKASHSIFTFTPSLIEKDNGKA
jgi:hypothetical protein